MTPCPQGVTLASYSCLTCYCLHRVGCRRYLRLPFDTLADFSYFIATTGGCSFLTTSVLNSCFIIWARPVAFSICFFEGGVESRINESSFSNEEDDFLSGSSPQNPHPSPKVYFYSAASSKALASSESSINSDYDC